MRVLAYIMLVATIASASVDFNGIYNPGRFDWYRFDDLFAAFGIVLEGESAAMTIEFLKWIGPASVTIVCLGLTGFFWIMQPNFIKSLIADWR